MSLTFMYLRRRAPESLDDGTWELTAGTGLVPKWVSEVGLWAIGFVPSGLMVALLILLGMVDKR
jgi:hypothetical protein